MSTSTDPGTRPDTGDTAGGAAGGAAPRRFTPPSLLTELLASGLDPGYAEAAARRASRPTHARRGADRAYGTLAVVVALVVGLVIALGWNEAHRSAPAQEALHAQLVERARGAGDAADALEKQVTEAAARVAALQNTALSGDAEGRSARAALVAAQIAAGVVAVKGPGLTVTLGDPSAEATDPAGGRAGSTPIGEVRIITDTDIRDLVNVLWGAGAQAVAVNQVRITPVSAIRFAGSDILVDLRTVSSPYTVRAIGDADALSVAFAQSPVAGRFATYAGERGVDFSFDGSADLSLAAGVVADPRYASTVTPTPATTPASTPTTSSPTSSPSETPTAGGSS